MTDRPPSARVPSVVNPVVGSVPRPIAFFPLRVALTYGVVAALWILATDMVLTLAIPDAPLLGRVAMYKGWGFVVVTSLLLYVGVRRGMRTVQREVADRVAAQAQAEVSEAKFRSYIEYAPTAVLVSDEDGNLIDANPAASRLLGYERAALLRLKTTDLAMPEDRAAAAASFAMLRREGRLQYECQFRRADGGSVWVMLSAVKVSSGRLMAFCDDITQRKLAEERVADALAYNRMFIDAAPVGVLTYRASGEAVSANATAARIVHGAVPDLLAHNFRASEPWRESGMLEAAETALTAGEPQHLESLHHSSDGRACWLACDFVPFRYEGSPHLLLLMLDITERRQSEQALAESVARYQSLFNNMFEGYVHCRLVYEQGRPVDFVDLAVNPAFEQLTGLKDVVGKRISHLLPGVQESNPEMFEIYHRVATTGEPARFQTHVRELGRWFSVAVHRPAPGEFVAVFDNITEQKHAEMMLRRNEALLSQAGRMAHLGAWEIEMGDSQTPESNRLHWSDEVYRIFGYAPGAVTPTSTLFYAALPAEDRERVAAVMRQALAHGTPYEVEHRVQRPDGTECVVIENAEIRFDASGKPVQIIGAVQDITEHRRAEAEIRALNQDLERRVQDRTAELQAANRELEAFSYSVSHDLRAPLRTMDGFALALLEDYAPLLPEAGRRFAEKIRQGAQRMGCLINDLLAFSRIVSVPLDRESVLTERLVREAFDELHAQDRSRHVALEVRELPTCCGDSRLLKQVWLNLLSNALKYTRSRELAQIEVGTMSDANAQVFYVRDNGVGFDMRYAHHLFGVFQRLHRADQFEGTGVGLAIVHRILERHGGRIWTDAAVDQGATFFFSLPLPAKAPGG